MRPCGTRLLKLSMKTKVGGVRMRLRVLIRLVYGSILEEVGIFSPKVFGSRWGRGLKFILA